MPKVGNTRKIKAQELLRLIKNGPSTNFDVFSHIPKTDAEINRQYKLWAESWVLPLIIELVPELKNEGK